MSAAADALKMARANRVKRDRTKPHAWELELPDMSTGDGDEDTLAVAMVKAESKS